jgi:CheY-like chemotaxis protein
MEQSPTILIVEDHHDIRESLCQWLEHQGYRTIGCASGVDALTVLQSGKQVCLILLDLMMPTVSGFQFREQQRASSALRDIPVAVISGAPRPQDYHGNLGAVAYLRKPLDPAVVLEVVQQYCGPPASTQPDSEPPSAPLPPA